MAADYDGFCDVEKLNNFMNGKQKESWGKEKTPADLISLPKLCLHGDLS